MIYKFHLRYIGVTVDCIYITGKCAIWKKCYRLIAWGYYNGKLKIVFLFGKIIYEIFQSY